MLIIPILVLLAFSPLGGQEGEESPLVIGFLGPDGASEIVEFADQVEEQPGVMYGTGSGIPSEPPGHQLVRLTNQKRINNGVPPLKAASELMDAAQYHSTYMADHNCFSHACNGEQALPQRAESHGYLNWTSLGENIAAGSTASSASVAIDAWMNSPSHRNNMLNSNYREAGGGYAFNGGSTYYNYWTLDLGARNDAQGNPVYPVIINNEAWSTTSLDVNLYVYGSGWASQVRFRNEGDNWSDWQSFSTSKPWTLSCTGGSPATVYAQIRQGSTILESSDEIHIENPFSVQPNSMIFLSEQGTTPTIPASYQMTITSCDSWSAAASRSWIKLSDNDGIGSDTVTVYLQGFPTDRGKRTATITVESSQEQANIEVTLVVTDGPLQHSYVPQTSVTSD